jgi:hypothetical protein
VGVSGRHEIFASMPGQGAGGMGTFLFHEVREMCFRSHRTLSLASAGVPLAQNQVQDQRQGKADYTGPGRRVMGQIWPISRNLVSPPAGERGTPTPPSQIRIHVLPRLCTATTREVVRQIMISGQRKRRRQVPLDIISRIAVTDPVVTSLAEPSPRHRPGTR